MIPAMSLWRAHTFSRIELELHSAQSSTWHIRYVFGMKSAIVSDC